MNGVKSVFLDHTVSSGEAFMVSSDLPIGVPDQDNLLDVHVAIADKYEGATQVNLLVTVVIVHYIIKVYLAF